MTQAFDMIDHREMFSGNRLPWYGYVLDGKIAMRKVLSIYVYKVNSEVRQNER